MQTFLFVRSFLRAYNVASIVVKSGRGLLLGLICVLTLAGFQVPSAHAQSLHACASKEDTYLIQKGDTLSKIASWNDTTWEALAKANHIPDPNLIYAGNTLCIIGRASDTAATQNAGSAANSNALLPATNPSAPTGTGNYFPYGQCTWWANQRYYQLHGVYVPWTTNSDAWQWTARALDFGWQVSSTPHVGDIIDLQPNVEGASALGHVAIVEKILGSGDVIASNMNWGINPQQVTAVEFAPGPGVTFIHQ